MKRTIITVIICTMAAMAMLGQTAMQRAARDYDRELYTQALEAYQAQAKTDSVSSDLFYNMGNTYYRLKDNAHAILCYERALALDPGNGDARHNLDFVRTRSGIDQDSGANILSVAVQTAVARFSSNTWAIIALAMFLLTIAALATYIFLDNVTWRKIGFFTGIIALLLTMCAQAGAWSVHRRVTERNQAIIMTNPAKLSTAPRAPKDNSEVAFELAAGHKVTIIDRVNTSDNTWLHVSTANNRQAWINAKDLEII